MLDVNGVCALVCRGRFPSWGIVMCVANKSYEEREEEEEKGNEDSG